MIDEQALRKAYMESPVPNAAMDLYLQFIEDTAEKIVKQVLEKLEKVDE